MSNAALAAVTIEEALRWGVRDFVVCTGARNAPLVLPLLDAPPPVRVWRHFEERSAAFFALGLAKGRRAPVAVVTTSGTAVAELFPAVIEAHYTGVPLVLITADRPKRFRSTGAPQAIEQAHLFGAYSEGCLDVEAAEDFPRDFPWRRTRPIQINPCFEEPGAEAPAVVDWRASIKGGTEPIIPCWIGDHTLLDRFVADFAGGVVVLGEIDTPDRPGVEAFLQRLGAPVWAEAFSGLRESRLLEPLLLPGGDDVFKNWQPTRVLRLGGVPSVRLWRDLENRPRIPVLSVTRTGFPGLARPCEVMGWVDFSKVATLGGSIAEGAMASAGVGHRLDAFPQSEAAWMRALSEIIPATARIFLGNSLPIREWNLAATREMAHADAFANRGANGIDGEISTFLGLSEGVEESWGIFGDLTALYDLSAPWVLEQLSAGRRRIVVVNNGGGRIFSRLPSLAGVDEAGKRVTENRHGLGFEGWARMWGMGYRRVSIPEELSDEMPEPAGVIEVIPDEGQTEAFWAAQ
jgi:2-succinyl-5-enolpyruvyl-6-hydroxy-3-cyclohexene-1-carboxylate synthase